MVNEVGIFTVQYTVRGVDVKYVQFIASFDAKHTNISNMVSVELYRGTN